MTLSILTPVTRHFEALKDHYLPLRSKEQREADPFPLPEKKVVTVPRPEGWDYGRWITYIYTRQ